MLFPLAEENRGYGMKKIVFAAAATAVLICTGGATATDTRTLSQFILVCNTSARSCHANLEDYLRAANDQGFICLPEGLSVEEAGSQELSWLRNEGASDDKLNHGTAEDAQWAAVSTLWPCKTQ
jgi:hypothetical protein